MNEINQVASAMGQYGATSLVQQFIRAQMMWESTDGTSRLARENMNFGGLTQTEWNGDDNKQPDGTNYYKVFNNPMDYARSLHNEFFRHYPEIYSAKSLEEYVHILKRNGYFGADESEYLAGLKAKLGEDGGIDLSKINFYGGLNPEMVFANIDPFPDGTGHSLGNYNNDESYDPSFGERLKDSFLNMWYDNGTIATLRTNANGMPYEIDEFGEVVRKVDKQEISQGAEEQARAILNVKTDDTESENYKAYAWARAEAMDNAHLLKLAQMKAEDIAREERLAKSSTETGNILGAIAGMVLDPLNFVPFLGQEAFAVKAMGKLGVKTASKLAGKTSVRIAELALTNGLINVADQKVSNVMGGHDNQNYVASFLLGAGLVSGLEVFRHLKGSNHVNVGKHVEDTENMLEKQTHEIMEDANNVKVSYTPKNKEQYLDTTVQQMFHDRGIYSNLHLRDVVFDDVHLQQELTKEIKVKYGNDVEIDTPADIAKYFNIHGDKMKWRSKEFVEMLDKIGAKTEQDLASYALANIKTKPYKQIKDLFSQELGVRLTDGQFKDISRHIKITGEELADLINIHKNGDVTLHNTTYPSNNVIAQALKNDFVLDPNMDMKHADEMLDEDYVPIERTNPFENEKEIVGDKAGHIGNTSTIKEVDTEMTKNGGNKILQKLSRWFGKSKWFGNRYDTLVNSMSNTIRKWTREFGIDGQQRGNTGKMAGSMRKRILMNQYNAKIRDYYKTYLSYCIETGQPPIDSTAQKFNATVDRVYNSIYDPYCLEKVVPEHESIKKAVQVVKEFRDHDLATLQQHGVVSKDFSGAGELWRRVDPEKAEAFKLEFENERSMRKFAKNYCKNAIDWENWTDQARKEYIMNANLSHAEVRTLMGKAGLEHKYIISDDMNLDANVPYRFADLETASNFVKTEILSKNEEILKDFVSYNYAGNMLSSLTDDGGARFAGRGLGYYQARIPMNTYYQAQLPSGAIFSYNSHLRNTDIASHMNYVANRSSGAIALWEHGIENIGRDLRNIYDNAKEELLALKAKGELSESQMNHQLQSLRDTMHDISGANLFAEDIEPDTVLDSIKRILLGNSFNRNGLNFGLNQVAEMLGNLSVVGARALTHYCPIFHDYIHDLRYSKDFTSKHLKHFRADYLGLDLAEYAFFNPKTNLINKQRMLNKGATMKALGQIEDIVNWGSKVTSTFSGITKLTNVGVSLAKADLVPQMMDWARGDFNSFFRKNLFSEVNLAEAGIQNPDVFKTHMLKYLSNLDKEDPKALSKAMKKWEKEANDTFTQFHAFLDINSQRAILQPHVWNQATKYKGLMGIAQALTWQFKNFSQMAIGSHLFRALNRKQREDFFQLMSGAMGAGMIYAVRARVNADLFYSDDDPRKEKFLERNLAPEKVMMAGLLRSSILSGFSFATDMYESVTGGFSTRTSVNRKGDQGGILENMISQSPAITSMIDTYKGAESVYDFARNINSADSSVVDPLLKLFPMDRYLPVMAVMAGVADEATLERRRMNHAKEMKEALEKRKRERKEQKQRGKEVQGKGILDIFK